MGQPRWIDVHCKMYSECCDDDVEITKQKTKKTDWRDNDTVYGMLSAYNSSLVYLSCDAE